MQKKWLETGCASSGGNESRSEAKAPSLGSANAPASLRDPRYILPWFENQESVMTGVDCNSVTLSE